MSLAEVSFVVYEGDSEIKSDYSTAEAVVEMRSGEKKACNGMKENKLFPQMILYEFRHSWPSCGYYRRDLVPYGSFPPFYIYLSI